MDVEKFGELVGASVTTGVVVTPEQVTEVLTDKELLQAVRTRGLVSGATGAVATKSALDGSPETSIPEQAPLSLLNLFLRVLTKPTKHITSCLMPPTVLEHEPKVARNQPN